jgi:hypothetical protein
MLMRIMRGMNVTGKKKTHGSAPVGTNGKRPTPGASAPRSSAPVESDPMPLMQPMVAAFGVVRTVRKRRSVEA